MTLLVAVLLAFAMLAFLGGSLLQLYMRNSLQAPPTQGPSSMHNAASTASTAASQQQHQHQQQSMSWQQESTLGDIDEDRPSGAALRNRRTRAATAKAATRGTTVEEAAAASSEASYGRPSMTITATRASLTPATTRTESDIPVVQRNVRIDCTPYLTVLENQGRATVSPLSLLLVDRRHAPSASSPESVATALATLHGLLAQCLEPRMRGTVCLFFHLSACLQVHNLLTHTPRSRSQQVCGAVQCGAKQRGRPRHNQV